MPTTAPEQSPREIQQPPSCIHRGPGEALRGDGKSFWLQVFLVPQDVEVGVGGLDASGFSNLKALGDGHRGPPALRILRSMGNNLTKALVSFEKALSIPRPKFRLKCRDYNMATSHTACKLDPPGLFSPASAARASFSCVVVTGSLSPFTLKLDVCLFAQREAGHLALSEASSYYAES